MNYPRKLLSVAILLCFALITPTAGFAESDESKTLSPYFLVRSDADEGSDLLPLKETSADVSISGVIADVRVTQVYKNEGNRPLEAIYIFPGSTRAAVHGMTMTIGERRRVAKIQEKKQAKKTYQKAKKEGKSASLLEQSRPNVFKMSVANIMPGDVVKVELSYTELLVPEDGTYEFSYPTVVGPRYSGQKSSDVSPDEQWVANPYLQEGVAGTYSFDITSTIDAGMPLAKLVSPSHDVKIRYKNKNAAEVVLQNRETFSGDRDYILRYQLQGAKIHSGMLLYEGDKENFFLMMMQPPERVAAEEMPPREYIYVVDVSGSMYGFPLDTSKKLLRNLLGNLRPQDSFNLLLFAGSSSLFSQQSLPATPDNISRAIHHLEKQRGGGGTELLPAMTRALQLPREENTSRTIVIATDGYIHVETDVFDTIRNNLGNANVFAFGIGSAVNRHLIEGIAHVGYGEPFVVTDAQQAEKTVARFQKYINTPVLSNIEVAFEGFDTYDIDPPSIPDLLAERPLILFGKWRGEAKGTLTIKGFRGEDIHEETFKIKDASKGEEHSVLQYLWARNKIKTLGEYHQIRPTDARREEITELGLRYNLLTKFTSFVAVDEEVRNPGGEQSSVKQALPLPKGVSNFAVGGSIPTAPEPETWALLLVLSILLGSAAITNSREKRTSAK